MSQPLLGKTALITGASRNLGAVIATTLAAQGAEIVVHYQRDTAAAEQVAHAAQAYGQPVHLVAGDLAHGDEVRGVVEQSLHYLGRPIDILVNNAGPFNGGC
jgi:3-oxoacyl-[acyl-carrier protein] reductase